MNTNFYSLRFHPQIANNFSEPSIKILLRLRYFAQADFTSNFSCAIFFFLFGNIISFSFSFYWKLLAFYSSRKEEVIKVQVYSIAPMHLAQPCTARLQTVKNTSRSKRKMINSTQKTHFFTTN